MAGDRQARGARSLNRALRPGRRLIASVVLLFAAAAGRAVDGPVMYLFAHQDDEVFVLGRMQQEVESGRSVFPVWITDGARDGKPAEREKESREVMALVGVPDDHLHFLGFPDHASIQHLEAIHEQVRQLQLEHGCGEIVSPAYEGGNIDHDVAAFIAAMVTRDAGGTVTHFEYPLYNHQDGHRRVNEFLPHQDAPVEYFPLDDEARQLVQESLHLYSSQRILLLMLEITGHKKQLLQRGEPFRRAVDYDFLERPADEPCGYEVSGRHRARFEDWLEAVGPFLAARSSAP